MYFLPAYLCASVRAIDELGDPWGSLVSDTTFQVTHINELTEARFSRLTREQRNAMISFLEHVVTEVGEHLGTIARTALDRYWLKQKPAAGE